MLLLLHVCARGPEAAGLALLCALTEEILADVGRDSLLELGRVTVAEYGLRSTRMPSSVRLRLPLSLSLNPLFSTCAETQTWQARHVRGSASCTVHLDWTEPAIFTDAIASLTSSSMLDTLAVMLVDAGRAPLPGRGGCSPETEEQTGIRAGAKVSVKLALHH